MTLLPPVLDAPPFLADENRCGDLMGALSKNKILSGPSPTVNHQTRLDSSYTKCTPQIAGNERPPSARTRQLGKHSFHAAAAAAAAIADAAACETGPKFLKHATQRIIRFNRKYMSMCSNFQQETEKTWLISLCSSPPPSGKPVAIIRREDLSWVPPSTHNTSQASPD